jgi:large subunit ribosomal protein L31e
MDEKQITTQKAEAKPLGNERFFTIDLNKAKIASRNKRAARAMRMVKEFLARQLGDKELKISPNINFEIWKRGQRNPPNRIEVKVLEKDNVFFAELKDKEYLLLKALEEKVEEEKKVVKEEKRKEFKEEEKEVKKEAKKEKKTKKVVAENKEDKKSKKDKSKAKTKKLVEK